MTYILVMQQGGGCDYTIGCGTKVVTLDSTTPEDAVVEAERVVDDHGGFDTAGENRVDSAKILVVTDTVPFDLRAIRLRLERERLEAEAVAKEAKDRAELARLKQRFEG